MKFNIVLEEDLQDRQDTILVANPVNSTDYRIRAYPRNPRHPCAIVSADFRRERIS
jgi:hypothetical protein